MNNGTPSDVLFSIIFPHNTTGIPRNFLFWEGFGSQSEDFHDRYAELKYFDKQFSAQIKLRKILRKTWNVQVVSNQIFRSFYSNIVILENIKEFSNGEVVG